MKVSKIIALIVAIVIALSATSYVLFAGGITEPAKPVDTTISDEPEVKPNNPVGQVTSVEAINKKIIEAVSNNTIVNSDGMRITDEKALENSINSLELAILQKDCESKGAVFTEKLTANTLMDNIKNGIQIMNTGIVKGKVEALKNGATIRADDEDFYIKDEIQGSTRDDVLGGSSYDKTYWWGRKRYKSTAEANSWQASLNKVSALNGKVAILAGAVFGAYGAIPNGLAAGYTYRVATDVSYVNSLSSRGIVADMYWWLYYKIRVQ
jgi:hypothetical protein